VLPADCRIEIAELRAALGAHPRLAAEGEIETVFVGCAPGAIPPLGYDVPTIVEQHLDGAADIYFEGGDHCSLVHLDHAEFARLTDRAPHARFARSVWLVD
jgi:Ala-tRNA(Pro) deacylase